MKKLFTILSILFSINYSAQNAVVVFQNQNNEPFQVNINHINQYNGYSTNIRVNNLQGNSPYNVKITFEKDTSFTQKNIFLIDDGLAHIYNVTKDTIQLQKIVPAVSFTKPENQTIVDYTINNALPTDTTVKDTATKDTAYIVPFASYYHLEDYKGRIGCPFPIKTEQLAELKGIIMAENLEESKLEKIKKSLNDMDSACVLVNQTKELILLFEFEETRLDFAKFMYQYTFDLDNYERLYSVFNFENSIDELKEFTKK